MKKPSLAAQFRHTFILIFVAFIAATALSYALSLYLFLHAQYRDIYPANYYEQQLPGIETYIRAQNTALLKPASEAGLKGSIHGEGMLYLVVDAEGNALYGTNSEKPFETKEELVGSFMNATVVHGGYYIHTVPITDDGEKTAGAVLLFYKIKPTFINGRGRLIYTAATLLLFAPALYFVGFVILFSKFFAKKVNYPLQLLIDASKKIKEKNLDFEIDYHADNELGKLCGAFSEMQKELKSSLSTQWQMEQERIEMVDALAHDLKSPISVILGYTDALLEEHQNEGEALCRYLSVIKKNAEKSAGLVQQMQYTSELEGAGVPLCPVPVNLPAFLTQKVEDYQLQAGQKKIALTLDMQESAHISVQVDANRLARILDNILSNSLQYTPAEGSIRLSIRCENETVFYEIRDTGSGFTPEDLKKAFDRFYRGDKARQTNGGHSGLGLSIARRLAEQLGGAIQIENTKSGGACVRFWHAAVPVATNPVHCSEN